MIVCREKANVLRFTIADGLVMSDQFFVPGDTFLIWHQLKNKVPGLPLKDIRSLTAQVLEQRLPNIEAMAYVNPLAGTAQAEHSG
jgi:hypothetical protein